MYVNSAELLTCRKLDLIASINLIVVRTCEFVTMTCLLTGHDMLICGYGLIYFYLLRFLNWISFQTHITHPPQKII